MSALGVTRKSTKANQSIDNKNTMNIIPMTESLRSKLVNKLINIRNLVSADVQLTTGKQLIEEEDNFSEVEE